MIRLITSLALCGLFATACGIDGAPRPPKAVAAEKAAQATKAQVDENVDENIDDDVGDEIDEPTDNS